MDVCQDGSTDYKDTSNACDGWHGKGTGHHGDYSSMDEPQHPSTISGADGDNGGGRSEAWSGQRSGCNNPSMDGPQSLTAIRADNNNSNDSNDDDYGRSGGGGGGGGDGNDGDEDHNTHTWSGQRQRPSCDDPCVEKPQAPSSSSSSICDENSSTGYGTRGASDQAKLASRESGTFSGMAAPPHGTRRATTIRIRNWT
jgi:hypothetical protein